MVLSLLESAFHLDDVSIYPVRRDPIAQKFGHGPIAHVLGACHCAQSATNLH